MQVPHQSPCVDKRFRSCKKQESTHHPRAWSRGRTQGSIRALLARVSAFGKTRVGERLQSRNTRHLSRSRQLGSPKTNHQCRGASRAELSTPGGNPSRFHPLPLRASDISWFSLLPPSGFRLQRGLHRPLRATDSENCPERWRGREARRRDGLGWVAPRASHGGGSRNSRNN